MGRGSSLNPLYGFPALPPTSDGFYYLLIDDDGDFTNGGTSHMQMTTTLGVLAQVMIANPINSYFSFGVRSAVACSAQAPILSK